jgi:hypothetical protein
MSLFVTQARISQEGAADSLRSSGGVNLRAASTIGDRQHRARPTGVGPSEYASCGLES